MNGKIVRMVRNTMDCVVVRSLFAKKPPGGDKVEVVDGGASLETVSRAGAVAAASSAAFAVLRPAVTRAVAPTASLKNAARDRCEAGVV